MKQTPGLMIYFDMIPVLSLMPREDRGDFILAMLQYAQTGQEPQLPEKLELLWPMTRNRIDFDQQKYRDTVTRRRYAAYTRWAKQQGQEVLSFETWCLRKVDAPAELA